MHAHSSDASLSGPVVGPVVVSLVVSGPVLVLVAASGDVLASVTASVAALVSVAGSVSPESPPEQAVTSSMSAVRVKIG